METASLLARIIASIASFAYMLLLIPHIGSIGSDPSLNMNPLYITAWAIAVNWILLAALHAFRKHLHSLILHITSFGSLIVQFIFFASLFFYA